MFTDLEIEDERPPYGRRMLSHSWPEEEDESWADEGVRPASEPPAVDAAVLTVARPVDATGSPDTSPEEPPVDEPAG